jgi:hypothetical protein
MSKCPVKNTALYKTIHKMVPLETEEGLYYMYNVGVILQNKGWMSLKKFTTNTSGKDYYKIPKIIDEKSLAQRHTKYGKNVKAYQQLKAYLEKENYDWVNVRETSDSYLISFEYPDLSKRIPSQTFTEEELQELSDYELSDQMIKEQEEAEDKERKIAIPEKQNNIKPGVEELFNQNLELANQVYEALGFNQLITSNDRIVFGHPTIGKSYLKKQGEDKFISLDDDYATEINNKVKEIADKYNVTTYQVKDGGTQKWNNEYNQIMQEMFNVAKQRAISENKTLFTSNTNLLRNNAEFFDKVINLTDVEFEKRIQERGAKYDIKEWKSQINQVIFKIPASKVINTNKYLSDLFITPQQKQQALQLYSQYLDQIFPNSLVKDIVYHGSYAEKIDKFSKEILGRTSLTGFLPKGFYFTNQQYVAATYTAPKDVYNRAVWSSLLNVLKGIKGERGEYIQEPISFEKLLSYIGQSNNKKEFIIDYRDGKLEDSFGGAAELGLFLPSKEDTELYLKLLRNKDLKGIENQRDKYSNKEGNIFSVILNIKNPLNKTSATGSITTINLEGRTTGEKKETLQKELKNSDGLIINDIRDSSDYKSKRDIKYNENIDEQTYVVFEPEQIHILGSKQDIEGFKEFINNNQGSPSPKFDSKFPNYTQLQLFEKEAIENNDDLDIFCDL